MSTDLSFIEEMIADNEARSIEACTVCGKRSNGVRCCYVDHPICEECAVVYGLYQYCPSHLSLEKAREAKHAIRNAWTALEQAIVLHRENLGDLRDKAERELTLACFYGKQWRDEIEGPEE